MVHKPKSVLHKVSTPIDREIVWSKLQWALPFLAVFLPIVLFGIYSFQIATQSIQGLVEAENLSATSNFSQLLTQDIMKNVTLASAVSSLPRTIEVVKAHDEVALRTRLKALVISSTSMDRAFVVGTDGVLWNEFPTMADLTGKDMTDKQWYKSILKSNKPTISEAYLRGEEVVYAVSVPIQTETGAALGMLVFEYQMRQITDWIKNITIGKDGYLYIVDHKGTLISHPYLDLQSTLRSDYRDIDPIVAALDGTLQTTEYVDPLDQKKMIATFIPLSIGRQYWVVVAQQTSESAFLVLNQVKRNISMAGGVLAFFTLIMVIALARMSSRNIRLNRALEEKNQALKDFTSIVSHQLKAPITAMRWTIESMLDGDYGDLNQEIRTELETLHGVNISNHHLIMDILNLSRLDRGVVAVETKAVPLKDIVERAVRDYKPAVEKAGLYLDVKGGDRDIVVEADLEKAAESITNSISNALKHTKTGGITVSMSTKDRKGIVEVSDTGEGMTPEMLEKLFKRDHIESKSASAEGSSGLGLYIAKQFMEMQGGDITVASEVGKGTKFTYSLDIANN